MSNIIVRKAKMKDLPSVADMVLNTFVEEIHNGISLLEDADMTDKGKFLKMYEQRAKAKIPCSVYIAEEEGKMIGVSGGSVTTHIWSKSSKWGCEDFWFVKKEHRGSRAGEMLFNELINWFKRLGAHRIMMTHYSWNPKIAQYYKKRGFVPFETNYVYKVKGD